MSIDIGIISFGAYIPKSRLQRSAIFAANEWFSPGLKGLAKGERSTANWDEDSITMGVEASRDALIDIDRARVATISLSSTTLPFADRLNAGVIKEALNLSDTINAFDVTGSQRAATSCLIQALKAVGSEPHLCIASELRRARPGSEAELHQGDAAAALLVGTDQPVAKYLGSYSVTIDFVDHYRVDAAGVDYTWESRWVKEEGFIKIGGNALLAAQDSIGITGKEIDHAVIAIPDNGVVRSLAQRAGIRLEAIVDTLISNVGNTGVAHPILMLVHALEKAKPGEKILVASFGQGLDAVVFEATPAIKALSKREAVSGYLVRRKAETRYQRFLFHRGFLDLERGMRAEMDQKQPATTLYRNRKSVFGLIAGRCTKTGSVRFPKSEISADENLSSTEKQEDYPLSEKKARVVTFTADALTYSPDPPSCYGMLDFEGGGRMTAEFTDVDSEEIKVGSQMRMVFRIKSVDEKRKFSRYFWKATVTN